MLILIVKSWPMKPNCNNFVLNEQVLTRFTPEQRDCYQEHEIDLKYLPKSHGYRYEMSNCLFEAAFERILTDCKCAPGFHNEGGSAGEDAMKVRFKFATTTKECSMFI